MLPPAFDVGTFLAQFRNQFFANPEILARLNEEIFLDAYVTEAGPPTGEFLRQVELFRARTNLGIASYLIKVGMGESEDLWRVLVEALSGFSLRGAEAVTSAREWARRVVMRRSTGRRSCSENSKACRIMS